MMMTRQLELRCEETKQLHSYVDIRIKPRVRICARHLTEIASRRCDEIEAKLAELKSSAARIFSQGTEEVKEKVSG